MNNFKSLLTIFLVPVIISCSSVPKVDSKKSQAPKEEKIYAIPTALFKANVMETDYTAIVTIKSAKLVGKNKKLSGYVTHVYTAEVKDTIKGPTYSGITFTVMAEVGIDPYLSKHPVVVSLCEGENKSLYVPDNGYVSDATDDLIAYAKSLKNMEGKYNTKRKSVCSQQLSVIDNIKKSI